MRLTIRQIGAFFAAAWRAGKSEPPRTYDEVKLDPDDLIRERLAETTLPEAIAMARVTALRDGHQEVAAALQAVLLLHLTGGSLAPVTALVYPDQASQAVN